MAERISIGGQTDSQGAEKDASEEELAIFWAGILTEMYQELIEMLDDENPQAASEDWWLAWEAAFAAFMIPYLQNLATNSAVLTMELSGVGIPMDDIIDGATRFSQSYGFSFVKDISQSTRAQLQQAITNYIQTPGADIEMLTQSITAIFGPVRAEMIAITETTRAFEVGLDIYEDGLNALGFDTDRLWHTMRDERVCEVCEPNEGQLRDADGWTISGIPAHPRDRCWTTIVLVEREEDEIEIFDEEAMLDKELDR